jgi:hypothetical protein
MLNPGLQKCLILLEKIYPTFPTFPHTAWKFRELAIKVKYKSAEMTGVFDVARKGWNLLGIHSRQESPPEYLFLGSWLTAGMEQLAERAGSAKRLDEFYVRKPLP